MIGVRISPRVLPNLVTVLTPGEATGTDAYGNPVPEPESWGTSVLSALVTPAEGSEVGGGSGRSDVVEVLEIFTRDPISVRARVRWDGGTFAVAEPPKRYGAYCVARLRRLADL